jgi:hypothetical protein
MPYNALAFVKKDYGSNYFDSTVVIDFFVSATSVSTIGQYGAFALVNQLDSTSVQMIQTTNSEGISVVIDDLALYLTDRDGGAISDNYAHGGLPASFYCTLTRTIGTTTLEIYSDSGRSSLVDTLTVDGSNTSYRYLLVAFSDGSGFAFGITGSCGDVNLISL